MSGKCLIRCCAVLGLSLHLFASETRSQEAPSPSNGEDPLSAAQATEEAPSDTASDASWCRCIGQSNTSSVARINEVLQRPLKSSGFHFLDTPLAEVAGLVQEDYDIQVQLDTPALEDVGLAPDEPLTIELRDTSLRSALRLLLRQLGLTYVVENDVLLITTPEAAERKLLTCVYQVHDLIEGAGDGADKALRDAITSCVATETWAVHGGGEAEIRSLQPSLLVISQIPSVHEQIRDLLATIRELRAEPSKSAAAAAPAAAEPLQTRAYSLSVQGAGESDDMRAQVRELIVQSMPEEQWKGRLTNGEPVILVVLPDRIVLRHKASVHESVAQLLADSGVAAALPPVDGELTGGAMPSGSMGGGFFRAAPANAD